MTEQPTETMTEQAFLGNPEPEEVHVDIMPVFPQHWPTERAVDPDEFRVRAAQRVAPAPLTPPTQLRPAPIVSLSRPYDLAQANILLRKSITAAAKLQLAREAAEEAEETLKQKLAAEELVQVESTEAERELLEFLRSAAEQ